MKTFLGVDGGGTKTDFLLIDASGAVLASHRGGSAYYPELGLDALQAMMFAGIEATLKQAGISAYELEYAFLVSGKHEDNYGFDMRGELVLGSGSGHVCRST